MMKYNLNKSRLLTTTITFLITSAPIAVIIIPLMLNKPVQAQEKSYAIYGDIFDKWTSLGGARSPLGNPTSDEQPAANGGRYNNFQNGFIYWSPKTGAHAVYGKIGEKWNQLGRERFGYPTSDEQPAANGGRYNNFENGGSIYWSPNTGAFAVYGDIAKVWNDLGRERGRLGYPTSDEQPVGTAGNRVTYFQRGEIYWNKGSRKTTVVYK